MSRVNFIIFSIVVSILFSGIILNGNAFAETGVKSTNFDKTTIIEFVNNDNVQIKTVKMWLGQDGGSFKSFKTEKNWTGIKTPQGLLIFSTDSPVNKDESIKFGIKTEIANPGINWRTIDVNGNDVSIGKITAAAQVPPQDNTTSKDNTSPVNPPATKSNFDSATFRIIPEKPKNGDSIRIVGDGFPPKQEVIFDINNKVLGNFVTDNTGHLIGKAKIPADEQADRVEFSLADSEGHKKTISIRITHAEVVKTVVKHLTVNDFPETVQPGQTVHVSGTAKPGSTLTITTKDSTGNKISEIAIPVDAQGSWSYDATIPPDIPTGSRQVEISDGVDVIKKTVNITILKTIRLSSSMKQYAPGETMVFNGTTSEGKTVEVVIKDPIGKEVFSNVIPVDNAGLIKFEFPTDVTSPKGTYVVIATDGADNDIVRVGLGGPPTESIVASFDKLNYSTSDKAIMTIRGPANVNVSILVIDPSDKPKGQSDYVKLGPNGQKEYQIDLSAYKSGVYSVILQYQQAKTTEIFTVGLQSGTTGDIKMQATKQTYIQGNSILVLGSANPNSLLNLKFLDPNGTTIRHKEMFTDKNGKFSDSTFRIPADGVQGVWTVRAESGANYADVKINVAGSIDKGFTITADKTTYKPKDFVKISGTGAGKSQTVVVTIHDSSGKEIIVLKTITTSDGIFKIDWPTPSDIPVGEYKASAKTASGVAEITFSIQ